MRSHRLGHHQPIEETLALLAIGNPSGKYTVDFVGQATVTAAVAASFFLTKTVVANSPVLLEYPHIGISAKVTLAVSISANTLTVPVTVTLFKNGAATGVSIVVPPTFIGRLLDVSAAIPFGPADQYDVQVSVPSSDRGGTITVAAAVAFS